MSKTNEQFDRIIAICHELFIKKMYDYGTAWRLLRLPSMTDQIYIKAMRIRNIEEKGSSTIDEDVRSEYIGIINYCSMALIQLELGPSFDSLDPQATEKMYLTNLGKAKSLMTNKNDDYGEAWRQMRISSYTDLILMKLNRIKEIEDKQGKTLVSEGIDANYLDMINYAIFAMIKIEFE